MHGRRTSEHNKQLDPDVRRALKHGGLHYASIDQPGIHRRGRPNAFTYVGKNGRKVTDPSQLQRIRKLAIPPAWQDVWISASPQAHIQAVGRDARGRRQYRYHEAWREARDLSKYDRVLAFARALPRIRRRARKDIRRSGLPREKVLAAVVLVMEKTLIRIGNETYARQNGSYGLTTLQDKHAKLKGKKVRFVFRGKSGIEHEIDLEDPTLARIVAGCRDLPGEELFQYQDETGVHDIGSADVNQYLREAAGEPFTAKDYRTWAGTVLAAKALHEFEKQSPGKPLKKNLLRAIETVASRLGNTKAVCRKCYIHPAVMTAYLDGTLANRLRARVAAELKVARNYGLDADEAAVLRMLDRKM